MLGRLILLFVLVPLADLFLLMVLSSYTSWQLSVALVIVSGIIGAWLAKRSSSAVWAKIRLHLASGQLSPDLLSDGAMILFAAGLLLTPGFLTDILGLSLLTPFCRRWYKQLLTAWFKKHVKVEVFQSGNPFTERPIDPENTVEGKVRETRED